MADGIIRWEDPPEGRQAGKRTTRRPLSLIAAQLRERPGQWALISESGDPTFVARINKGVSWWAPEGAYEATSRTVDGKMHVYARYK